MDWHSIQEAVGSKNTPGRFMLMKLEISPNLYLSNTTKIDQHNAISITQNAYRMKILKGIIYLNHPKLIEGRIQALGN